jgi:hypothetical protein
VGDTTLEMTAWTDSTMTCSVQAVALHATRRRDPHQRAGARLVRVDEDGHHFMGGSYALNIPVRVT